MPLTSIGPPVDRPIVPSRRPDRVGDFDFRAETASPAPPSSSGKAEDRDAEEIRRDFLDMLDEELKGL